MDAGFMSVVEIGQYFMTEYTSEFSTSSCLHGKHGVEIIIWKNMR